MADRRRGVRLNVVCALIAVAAFCALQAAAPAARPQARATAPAEGDEFVGPFPSWTNVKTVYGAVGDGTADDTAALQKGLAGLHDDAASPVLYLPAGTYRITATLVLAHDLTVAVIGADPETVRIVWDGPVGGRMLYVNGVAYSSISRLTFDGRGRAAEAVAQAWDNTGGEFDTGNEYADDRFIDVGYGIHGGFLGSGFAETSVTRARFVRNTTAGIGIGNFNALDLWVRDSLFDHCAIGITNDPGAGNYRVYNSVFRASRIADLFMQNTGLFSARGNYSSGSRSFFVSGQPLDHPANVDLQRNTIVDPIETTAIRLANQGPGLLLDNVIRSRAGVTGPVVSWRSPSGSDIATIGNTFTVTEPVSANGRVLALDDRVVAASTIRPAEPALPPARPFRSRKVFEVPPGSRTAAVQDVIAAAARETGRRPIVHFPFGTFDITDTLVVPASDLQLSGDGARSVLRWRGAGPGPIIRLVSPTHVTLRDLTVAGTPSVDGIVAEGLDARGSRVRLDGVQTQRGEASNLLIDRLDEARVDMTDVGHGYAPHGASVVIRGGPSAPRPGATGVTTIYSGASSDNRLSYDISGHARVLIRDIWYEAQTPGFAEVRDGATVTFQGARVATSSDATRPAFAIDRATVALLSVQLDDRIAFSGRGPATLLGLGLVREFQPTALVSGAGPSIRALLIHTRQRPGTIGADGPGTLAVPDEGRADPALIRRLLDTTRSSSPPRLTALPSSVPDLRMFRISVRGARNNIWLGE
jgi:hypothetical protein